MVVRQDDIWNFARFSSISPVSQAMERTESFGNYNLIKRVKLDCIDVIVSKWQSSVTGLTVIHIDFDAPIVKGYLIVPTEIFDDSGCPHTLEHLVFMGSEQYPHKGSLDQLASRAFSTGTSAWTKVDHTYYAVATAGGQGLLQLLPVYVDHILYPTITDAAFVTEVHHIDGEGHDNGVVYCETQGKEKNSEDLMFLRLNRLLDGPGSGYRSETSGLMEALRTLKPDQIRKYHASYYVPHNLALIVAGKLTEGTSSLLRVVQEQIEPSLIQHNQNKGPRPAGWKRPFFETASAQRKPIPATTKSVVEFPEKDESMGELLIGFLGPPPNDFLTMAALKILGEYLTSSTVAPLKKEYLEIDSPLCSYIHFSSSIRATYINLTIQIGSVPTKNLNTFNEKLAGSLKRIVENGIEMERMVMVINSAERLLRSRLESLKGDLFVVDIFEDVLYGPEDGSELLPSMDDIAYYNTLRFWTRSQWADLLSKFYVEQPSIVIIGKPSAILADNIEQGERVRIAKQVETLGPEGLREVERKLEAAKMEHSKSVPTEILTSFPIPDVKSIFWIPVQTVQEPGIGRDNPHVSLTNGLLQKHIESDGDPLPFFVEYDHVESDFVGIHAWVSLAKMPNHLRPYTSAYVSAFFSFPVVRHNGMRLTHEDVVNQLDNDTVSYEAEMGDSGQFGNIFRVSIKVEHSAYDTAVAWLRDLIYGSVFERSRIHITLAKIQQGLHARKRDEFAVLSSLQHDLMYTGNSTPRSSGVLQQAEFIPTLIQKLQETPENVVADFESIRKYIIDPSEVRFSVTGNILSVKQPRSTWATYFGPSLPPAPLSPVPLSNQTLSTVGRNCSGQAIIMSLPTFESSSAQHTTKCIQGFDHPDYPVVQLAVDVLGAIEGYLWRYIRGSGLTYSTDLILDVEAGLLDFSLHQSCNPVKAFQEAASMIRGLVDGSIELIDTDVVAAMGSTIYQVTREVRTASCAARESFINQALQGVSKSHRIDLVEKYQTIKKEDILAAFQKYFLPLFDPASSVVVVVTAPGNAQRIAEELTSLGFDVTQKERDF